VALNDEWDLVSVLSNSILCAPRSPCTPVPLQPVDLGNKSARRFAVHKRGIRDQLCALISDLLISAILDVTLRRLDLALSAFDTHDEGVFR
jgi:hypothetical protein